MDYYVGVLKKYAVFEGRATRSEFWYFVLFNIIVSIGLGAVNHVIFGQKNILGLAYSLAVFLPSLGVSVRRLHDTGKSGWFLLVAYIPLALLTAYSFFPSVFPFLVMFPVLLVFLFGAILLFAYYVTESMPGANMYGPNPKETVVTASSDMNIPPVNPAV